MWDVADVWFELYDELSDAPVVTFVVMTPAGRIVIMAEPSFSGRSVLLQGLDIEGLVANAVGPANLKVIARAAMQEFDLDEIVVEGADRTSGAHPGRTPGMLRFTR